MTSAERLKEYEDLFARSQAYNPAQFQAGFEKDYGEATNYNKDLIDQRAAVIGEMQSLPAQLRSQYATSGIRNPLEQEALIAQRRGIQTADLNRITDFLAARGSKYEDVLGKYLQGYLADQSAAERAAENAWRMYQDVLAQEEAEKSRRAAAAQQAALGDLLRRMSEAEQEVGEIQEGSYRIPVEESKQGLFERKPTLSNLTQDALASGILRYRNAPNALAKYWELLKGSTLSSVAGLPGLTAYVTAVGPDVWGDVKGGVSNLWNKLKK